MKKDTLERPTSKLYLPGGPPALIETIYLSALCRKPSAEESARAAEYFATAGEPKAAGEDLMWALINSPGFLFNR